MKAGGMKTWKELATGVQQLVRLPFNKDFINPGLVLENVTLLNKCQNKVCYLAPGCELGFRVFKNESFTH